MLFNDAIIFLKKTKDKGHLILRILEFSLESH